MSLCPITGYACRCQPDEGMTCTGPEDLQQAAVQWRAKAERLAAALFRHACYCGCGDPNPVMHATECVYRRACSPDPTL